MSESVSYNELNSLFCSRACFIVICNAFGIDYSTIAHLKNNIHMINRSYPRLKYNNRYLLQELVTLYSKRGYKKGTIGSKVLNKESSYLFAKGRQAIAEPIKPEDMSWQYSHTIDWSNLDKSSVLSNFLVSLLTNM